MLLLRYGSPTSARAAVGRSLAVGGIEATAVASLSLAGAITPTAAAMTIDGAALVEGDNYLVTYPAPYHRSSTRKWRKQGPTCLLKRAVPAPGGRLGQ